MNMELLVREHHELFEKIRVLTGQLQALASNTERLLAKQAKDIDTLAKALVVANRQIGSLTQGPRSDEQPAPLPKPARPVRNQPQRPSFPDEEDAEVVDADND